MSGRKFIVIIIDDRAEIRSKIIKIIKEFLYEINFNLNKVKFKELENAEHATKYFENNGKADIVTLDYHMTGGKIRDQHLNGDAFLKNLINIDLVMTIIGVTTDPKPEIRNTMRKLGCVQVIEKNKLADKKDQTGERQAFFTHFKVAIKIYKLLENEKKDQLTGLSNRRSFYEEYSKTENFPKCVIMLDIDYFKSINDEYGHAAGDNVLKKVSSIIKKSTKDNDLVARWGGEEFIIITRNSNIEKGIEIAERIRIHIEKTIITIDNNKIDIRASLGITEIIPDEDIDTSIKIADEALYKAKNSGRNKVVQF